MDRLHRVQRFHAVIAGLTGLVDQAAQGQQRVGDRAVQGQGQPALFLLVALPAFKQVVALIDGDLAGHHVQVVAGNHLRVAQMGLAAGDDIDIGAEGSNALALGGVVLVDRLAFLTTPAVAISVIVSRCGATKCISQQISDSLSNLLANCSAEHFIQFLIKVISQYIHLIRTTLR